MFVKTNASLLIVLLALCASVGSTVRADDRETLSLYDLKVEHLREPIQLDIERPRFSWKLRVADPETKNVEQQSWHVLVASSPELLADNQGDLWDSGQVESGQSVLVPYQGKPLSSRRDCYWKVRVTDNQGGKSDWSDVARWEMGLLDPTDWSGAQWIGLKEKKRDHELSSRKHLQLEKDVQPHASPLLRNEITIAKSVRKARAYVSGIGYSELYINGKKISDHVLDPGQTNYEKHTLYVVHDVTKALQQGTNALGVWLGNGFYGQNIGFRMKFGYGRPSVRAKLFVEYTDGTKDEFVTDTSWKATPSPIVFDNVYWGESYDARLEIPNWSEPGLDDASWQSAIEVPSPCPDERLRAQLLPPIKEIERLKPVEVKQVEPDTWLFDFGKNIAGWVEITVNQKAGDVIRIFPAEVVTKDPPRADQVTYGGAPGRPHELYYVCKGGGKETWAPRFTYTGFQYAEISGLKEKPDADSVQAVFVRSAIEKTGDFSCSHELLNQQYEASLLSMEGNVHSLPEDCPHREKCGWLGDAHATADLCLYNYDIFRFYAKYNRDIQDSLIKRYNDGSGTFKIGERKSKVPKGIKGVPTFVAPGKRSARLGSIDWGVACLILPWRMYLHTGDVQSFEPHYEHVKDFISFYRTYKNENGVIDNGLGDWCPPRWDRRKAPEFMECHPFVSGTAFYYQALKIASEMADVLGDRKFSRQCRKEAKEIKAAFNDVYLKEIENSDLKHYGSQTATVMALNLGMVESADVASRVEALVHDIIHRHDGHHSCGIHGQRHLYSVLADHGQDELAYQMLTDMTFPSPGYVLSCGLSTWPERRFEWKNVRLSNSFNHPMNGAFAAFMHESLGGIRPDESKPGYQHFVLKPHLTGQLDWTKAQFESPYGLIRSDWKNDADSFVWEIEIPPNATATVFVPCSADQELTEKLSANQAITVNENQLTWRQLDVGSGVYRFVVK